MSRRSNIQYADELTSSDSEGESSPPVHPSHGPMSSASNAQRQLGQGRENIQATSDEDAARATAMKDLQLELQALKAQNRLLKEETASLKLEGAARKRRKAAQDVPDTLLLHDEDIKRKARHYGMCIEMCAPTVELLKKDQPSSPSIFNTAARYATSMSHETAVLQELYDVLPAYLHEHVKSHHFAEVFTKALDASRRVEMHKLREAAPALFDLSPTVLQDPDRADLPEIQKLLGKANPRYTLFPPFLFPGLKVDETLATVFGNWELIAKGMKVVLFGKSALATNRRRGGPKPNGVLWGVTTVTPGLLSWVCTMIAFVLGPDKEFNSETGKGEISKMPFYDMFYSYKQLAITNWDTPRLQNVIKQISNSVFGASSLQTSSAPMNTGEDFSSQLERAIRGMRMAEEDGEDGENDDHNSSTPAVAVNPNHNSPPAEQPESALSLSFGNPPNDEVDAGGVDEAPAPKKRGGKRAGTRSTTGRAKRILLNPSVRTAAHILTHLQDTWIFSAVDEFTQSKRVRRATFPSASTSSLTINEPTKDQKGKKCAAPEADSEEEEANLALSSTSKRTRTTAYSLRSRAEASTSISAPMPKKSEPSPTKANVAAKAEAGVSASSSRMHDEDVEMLDAEILKCDDPTHGGDDNETSPTGGPRRMVSLSNRLKTMLNNIKSTASPAARLVALQELSELLSISTEDGGIHDDGGDDTEDWDLDAALAAALAMSTGGTYQGDDNLEAQMPACGCLTNLMEALPGMAHTVPNKPSAIVGSGIFHSGDPAKRARAIAQAVTHYNSPKVLAEISEDPSAPMVGLTIADYLSGHRLIWPSYNAWKTVEDGVRPADKEQRKISPEGGRDDDDGAMETTA
ncbi:hypothetical protein HYDPIDRAFT_34032 [Hydnomerulius pinastri MD-312]|uniref:Uncharacterized protein n=1 Tax=Hydnomerulius pinastri MD-312 TaxID=994086 RepID=A0A0C9VYW3_9AGAM|nr:hypothetical protein HYDPIDRAFT_34032 [Hydnomerulius pinastri MD-312]